MVYLCVTLNAALRCVSRMRFYIGGNYESASRGAFAQPHIKRAPHSAKEHRPRTLVANTGDGAQPAASWESAADVPREGLLLCEFPSLLVGCIKDE